MSRASPPEEQPSAVDEEAAYYQAVEEFFVSRRGDPLFLSSSDWLLIRQWRAAGIPLRVVLRGIGDALEAHAHSWSRDRKVGSLRYCAAEVDVAHERWERAVTAGTESADVVAGLERLARALAAASGLGLGSAARSREILARLKGIEVAARPGDTEAWLSAEERQLLEEIGREAPDLAARAAKEVADEIAPYRRRMPARVAEQIEKDALARRLLGVYGLPRLSLFLQ